MPIKCIAKETPSFNAMYFNGNNIEAIENYFDVYFNSEITPNTYIIDIGTDFLELEFLTREEFHNKYRCI